MEDMKKDKKIMGKEEKSGGMMDMGRKMSATTAMGGMRDEMTHPEMQLEDSIPEGLAKKDVGDECDLMVKGKVISKSEDNHGGKSHKRMTVKIMKMGLGKQTDSKHEKKEHETT